MTYETSILTTGLTNPVGIAFRDGVLYCTSWGPSQVFTIDPSNGQIINSNFISGTNAPGMLFPDTAGNWLVPNAGASFVGKYASDGTTINSEFLSNLANPRAVTCTDTYSFVSDTLNNHAVQYGETGEIIRTFSTGLYPSGIVQYGGWLYCANNGTNTITKINIETGDNFTINLVAGETQLNGPFGLAVDTDGNIYCSFFALDIIVRIDQDDVVTVPITSGFLGDGSCGLAVDNINGRLYCANYTSGLITVTNIPIPTPPPSGDIVDQSTLTAFLSNDSETVGVITANLELTSGYVMQAAIGKVLVTEAPRTIVVNNIPG